MANIQFNLIKKGISFIGFFFNRKRFIETQNHVALCSGDNCPKPQPYPFHYFTLYFFSAPAGGGGGAELTQIEGICSNT